MVKSILGVVLAFVVGCSSSMYSRPARPLSSETVAEVEHLRAQAQAIQRVAAQVMNGVATPIVGGRAQQANTLASDAEIKLGFVTKSGNPNYIPQARDKVREAQILIADAITAGGQITPGLCKDADVAAALRDQCAKLAAGATAEQVTQDLNARMAAATNLANDALNVAGSEQSKVIAQHYAYCNGDVDHCTLAAAHETDLVGANAGMVLYLSNAGPGMAGIPRQRQVELAERWAAKAHAEAENVARARVQQQVRLDSEVHLAMGYEAQCQTNSACKAKCDGGDAWWCYGLATKLADHTTPPNYPEAQRIAANLCSAGEIASACPLATHIQQEQGQYDGQVNDAWGAVQRVGDDLAGQAFEVEKIVKYEAGTREQPEKLRQGAVFRAATVTERYCPAKRAFVTLASVAEFTKRASVHCTKDPPTDTGYSGGQVPLGPQCAAAFATPCQ